MQIEKSLGDLKTELSLSLNELNRQLEQVTGLKTKLATELDEKLRASQAFIAEKQGLLTKLEQLQKQFRLVQHANPGMQQSFKHAEFEVLKQDNKRLSDELAELKAKFDQQQKNLKMRFDELAKLTQLLMEQDSKIVDLQNDLKTKHRAYKEFKEKHKRAEKDLKLSQKKRKEAELELSGLKKQPERGKGQAIAAADSLDQKHIMALKHDLEEQQEHNQRLQQELEETRRELKVAWQKRKKAEALYEELKAKAPKGTKANKEKPVKKAKEPEPVTAALLAEVPLDANQAVDQEDWSELEIVFRELARLEEQADEIRASGLFDETWYLQTYPDVAEAQVDPVEHFLKYGWLEGRNPNASFDTGAYLEQHPNVLDSDLNPLLYFIRFGSSEQTV